MEEARNREPQLQLNRLYTANSAPFHLRVVSEFDMTQEYNRSLYQFQPSRGSELEMHIGDDEYLQLDPFTSHRQKTKGWEYDNLLHGSSAHHTSGLDYRQSSHRDSRVSVNSQGSGQQEPRPIIHNGGGAKGSPIEADSNLLTIKLTPKPIFREISSKPERITQIRPILPCIQSNRNLFLQGPCEKCRKPRLLFRLYLMRTVNGLEDAPSPQESYCVRCLLSVVSRKHFMEFLRIDKSWDEAPVKYPVLDELRLTTDLFRCQISSVGDSGNKLPTYGDDQAFVNYVLRDKLTQVEKLNSQLTWALSNISKKMNDKERLLAFKVIHDNLSCMVTLHMILMKRTLKEKFEALNKEEQGMLVLEIRQHISQMVSSSSYLSNQGYEQPIQDNPLFDSDEIFAAQYLGKRPPELSFEDEMQYHEHHL